MRDPRRLINIRSGADIGAVARIQPSETTWYDEASEQHLRGPSATYWTPGQLKKDGTPKLSHHVGGLIGAYPKWNGNDLGGSVADYDPDREADALELRAEIQRKALVVAEARRELHKAEQALLALYTDDFAPPLEAFERDEVSA